jgi:hypothetical protein
MRRFTAVFALASVAFLVPSTALGAPSLDAAERLCEAQGGSFIAQGGGGTYACNQGDFNERQLSIARILCENAYQGSFTGVHGHYDCDIP